MGRNTDKLYVTQSEHSGADGRHGSSTGITHRKSGTAVKRLPFIFCALTLQIWEHPVCVVDAQKNATIFDLLAIVPWLQSKGTNPVNGARLDAKDLVKLNFAKNEQDEFCDPVTMKVFNDHTHLVAIRHTGNVYAQETLERLNYKAKHWKDLITDEAFTRDDVITIQDPHNLADNNVPKEVREQTAASDGASATHSKPKDKSGKVDAARAAIERLRTSGRAVVEDKIRSSHTSSESVESKKDLPYNAAHYSTGYTAASFTNSGMAVKTGDDRALLTEAQYLLQPKKIKTKGLGIIRTNHGSLDVELWPEHAPKAVYNFVKLAKQQYYNGVTFHRNIPGFMIQGGDPSGRGTGGRSIYGKDFEDELSPSITHNKRGLICMANKGPSTNSSQFFITYDTARHLDKKHTIFGEVIGNHEVLDKLERVPTKGDKPKSPIVIEELQILLDPFDDYLEKESQKRSRATKKRETTEDDLQTWTSLPARTSKSGVKGNALVDTKSTEVGKYLTAPSAMPKVNGDVKRADDDVDASGQVRKKVKTGGFKDFSGW